MPGLSKRIAEFVTTTNFADIPELARSRGARAIIDTLGVMTAGSASELAEPICRYAEESGAHGNVPILGTGKTTDGEKAALINAAFGHALDFDDGYPYYPVHASVVVLGALISALSEIPKNNPMSGQNFLEAYILGIEVVTCIGRGMGMGHYIKRGFHSTGTLSGFATVVALAKLKAVDADTLQRTIGIVASMSSGIQRNFGTMMKPLHSGMAAQNGVIATAMAAAGITAHMDIMEGKDNFFQVYGDEGSSAEKAGDLLGNPFAFVQHGIGMKNFPSSNACARPIDGVLQLREKHGLNPDNVAKIHLILPPGGTNPLRSAKPETTTEAPYSMEFSIAVALVDGAVRLHHFTKDAIQRTDLLSQLGKVSMEEDPRCIAEDPLAETRGPGPRGFIEVHVTTVDGQAHHIRVDIAPGYPGRELSSDALWAKFSDCTGFAGIDQKESRDVFDRLERLDEVLDIANVIHKLA